MHRLNNNSRYRILLAQDKQRALYYGVLLPTQYRIAR